MNKEFLNIVEESDEPSYTFNNSYIVGEDVGEWTAEEFYADMLPEADIFQEGLLGKAVGKKLAAKLIPWANKHPKSWLYKVASGIKRSKAIEKGHLLDDGYTIDQSLPPDVVLIPALKREIAEKTYVSGFFKNAKFKGSILTAFVFAVAIATEIVQQKMYKKVLGRFPADLANFYLAITEFPEVLSQTEVKKFKTELKKLKKDTKWMVGSYTTSAKFVTPKEKKLIELMDEQIDDMLHVITNSVEKQRQRRILDRVGQFVETSEEFLKLIHADMKENEKVETVREYMI